MKILAIDAGSLESGFVIIDSETLDIIDSGIVLNEKLLEGYFLFEIDRVIIEMFASYGMPVGKTSFDTVVWIGRYYEYFRRLRPVLITRREVKMNLCNSARAKDSNVTQAVKDLYPPIGGGKNPTVGTKNKQGKLYGISSHMWSALALAIAYIRGANHYQII